MTCSRRRFAGFTLIELEVMIVMVSVGLAGVMVALNVAVQSSADPMVRKQMLSIGEGLLAEILARDFDDPYGDCTPTTTPSCRTDTPANRILDRRNYNDVSDYHGFATNGIYRLDGSSASGLESYNIAAVDVSAAPLGDVGAVAITCGNAAVLPVKRITVTVSHGTEQLNITGWRTCHDRR